MSVQRASYDYRWEGARNAYRAVVWASNCRAGDKVSAVVFMVCLSSNICFRTLVRGFPEAGLGVFYAGDGGTVYESEVYAASHSGVGSPRKSNRRYWGDRAVLILIGQKLGLTGVNEIYFDSIKVGFPFIQPTYINLSSPRNS